MAEKFRSRLVRKTSEPKTEEPRVFLNFTNGKADGTVTVLRGKRSIRYSLSDVPLEDIR